MTDRTATLWERIGASRGARHDCKVAQQLSSLSSEWHLLHAIALGGRGDDGDHVAIGPGGVFNLDIKCHPDATIWLNEDVLRVNGHPTAYLREARFEAGRISRLLSEASGAPVRSMPVIVFVDLLKITVRARPADVLVTTGRSVRNLLRHQPHRLTPEQVEQIFCAARDGVRRQLA